VFNWCLILKHIIKQSKVMMTDNKLVRAHIDALMLEQAATMKEEVDKVSTSLQEKIVISELSDHMKAIMKMWSRVSPLKAMSKLNEAIKTIVEREMKLIVIDHLLSLHDDLKEDEEDRILDTSDLSHALEHTHIDLLYLDWNMIDKLENGALRIMTRDGDTLLHTDYLPFSWYDAETKTFLYEQDYIEECAENVVHIMTPKVLPSYFKHPDDWSCVICLGDDTVPSTCVVTTCTHVYHKSCLLSWKSKSSLKKHDKGKGCFTCPSCRTNICME
jgi:hypothetical protein